MRMQLNDSFCLVSKNILSQRYVISFSGYFNLELSPAQHTEGVLVAGDDVLSAAGVYGGLWWLKTL